MKILLYGNGFWNKILNLFNLSIPETIEILKKFEIPISSNFVSTGNLEKDLISLNLNDINLFPKISSSLFPSEFNIVFDEKNILNFLKKDLKKIRQHFYLKRLKLYGTTSFTLSGDRHKISHEEEIEFKQMSEEELNNFTINSIENVLNFSEKTIDELEDLLLKLSKYDLFLTTNYVYLEVFIENLLTFLLKIINFVSKEGYCENFTKLSEKIFNLKNKFSSWPNNKPKFNEIFLNYDSHNYIFKESQSNKNVLPLLDGIMFQKINLLKSKTIQSYSFSSKLTDYLNFLNFELDKISDNSFRDSCIKNFSNIIMSPISLDIVGWSGISDNHIKDLIFRLTQLKELNYFVYEPDYNYESLFPKEEKTKNENMSLYKKSVDSFEEDFKLSKIDSVFFKKSSTLF